MGLFSLFSKREKLNDGKVSDVLQYENLPEAFRVQVVHILRDQFGLWQEPSLYMNAADIPTNRLWIQIFKTLTREKGTFTLVNNASNPTEHCIRYLLESEARDALDLIDVSFNFINGPFRRMNLYELQSEGIAADPDAAIAELNARFREHGIGYEFMAGELIRIDSQMLHVEAVKPAIRLMSGAGPGFSGPLEEFIEAHQKYRKGDHKDAIHWAGKSLESALKSICTARRWAFDPNKDTAIKLIEIVFANGLIPTWMQSQFAALRSVMESGAPTVRNKTAGHGQGPTPTAIPEHFARYALNLAATNIVFLIESHLATP